LSLIHFGRHEVNGKLDENDITDYMVTVGYYGKCQPPSAHCHQQAEESVQ